MSVYEVLSIGTVDSSDLSMVIFKVLTARLVTMERAPSLKAMAELELGACGRQLVLPVVLK